MKVLALPGRNPETEAWMQSLVDRLALGQSDCRVAHYHHWDSGRQPNVTSEATRYEEDERDLLIGKSFGTLVLLGIVARGSSPGRAVFIGTPVAGYPPEAIRSLQEFAETTPSLFIQQSGDFTGSFAQLAAAVGDAHQATLVEVAGDDHVYADVDELAAIIRHWSEALEDSRG